MTQDTNIAQSPLHPMHVNHNVLVQMKPSVRVSVNPPFVSAAHPAAPSSAMLSARNFITDIGPASATAVVTQTPTITPTAPFGTISHVPASTESGTRRNAFLTTCTVENLESAESPLMISAYEMFESRGAELWCLVTSDARPLTRAGLFEALTRDFADRAVLVSIQWRQEDMPYLSGFITCGPQSCGSETWRLGAGFHTTHKVPMTLSVMQGAIRFWYSMLGAHWPLELTWRTVAGSMEARRVLETILVFHAKRPDGDSPAARAASQRSAMTTEPISHGHRIIEVKLGSGSRSNALLSDLATWGIGAGHWEWRESPPAVLRGTTLLPPTWRGQILHVSELPMHNRGFQHLTPSQRAELIGPAAADALDAIAVTPRAALETVSAMLNISRTQLTPPARPASSTGSPPPQAILGFATPAPASDVSSRFPTPQATPRMAALPTPNSSSLLHWSDIPTLDAY